ncbi:transcriptional regulator [Natronorubrum sp. JWXQ-INN-674]|uniref:Transcriptional regulator n=1 Tax=Natronorubrum halalkaliphilum TaxID=2691917 RepID=A0A6B0VGQ4_9EURY|nr:transcriptional regulator [Natronorubrum halalkaliphilum]MXV60718.1 transcriptional regulator [Natronorubrum halalkaliphilum]
MDEITFAILGTGGIGRRALEVSQHKENLTPVAACDRRGTAIDFDGLDVDELLAATEGNIDNEVATDGGATSVDGESGVKQHGEGAGIVASAQGRPSEDPIQDVIDYGDGIDAVLLALPNYEHDFIPRTADRFLEGGYSGVMIDVLKRSRVIDMLDDRSEAFENAGITFICGAGATPGLLTGAAALAAQTFVEVTDVDIWWGVGLKSGYEDNRGTVREDIAHLPEYDIETARELSDDEIESIIDDHDGVIEFEDMEHADDVLLERAGVCDAEDVTVGGVLDVESNEKPTTTTVSVTGRTFDGETATNTFQLGDATSMEANVNGPALGYLQTGVRRNRAGEYGVFGPAELMPGF